MFDLFGGPQIDIEKLNEHLKASAINYTSLLIALDDAGVLSCEQLMAARPAATSMVDQHWAKCRDEQEKEFAAKHPGMAALGEILRPSLERMAAEQEREEVRNAKDEEAKR